MFCPSPTLPENRNRGHTSLLIHEHSISLIKEANKDITRKHIYSATQLIFSGVQKYIKVYKMQKN